MTVKDFLENEKFILFMLFKDTESIKHWDLHLSKHPEDKIHFQNAEQAFKKIKLNPSYLQKSDKEALHKRIFEATQKSKIIKINRKRNFYSAIAACALILILIKVYNTTPTDLEVPKILVEKSLAKTEIELIASGKTFTLSNKKTLTVSKEGTINAEGKSLKGSDSTTYNILKVPFGKRTELVLADGSKLWVNSGSTVKFPSKFNKNKREIYLEGEIYIEVAKNKLKPFNVKTSNFDVNVYGTTFDVKAYKDNEEQRVVLVEGSVGVSTIDNMKAKMLPSESLDITASKLIKTNVDTEIYTSWKNGFLIFDDKPLEEILIELSRYYNVTFSDTKKELINKKCTGKIYLSSNLEDVLETLSTLSNSSFKIQNNI
ncbi:FecR family protein [Polaribacter sp. Q13]|uniref:FecR family protein n=1 Tax=Polaribacter sp. Q13 TaxID=2806551 RepID=UPI00193C603E|nr:FecR family protein [Polaribacter sp. Q13]QVY66873.1 FecR domain-containing protein [Polaribacter sp. Q13]